MITATNLLFAAHSLAMSSNPELNKKWIAVSHKLGALTGGAHLIALQRNGRLDLLLRMLEAERAERLAQTDVDASEEPDWALDLQFTLSANWVLAAYEVARAAKIHMKNAPRRLKDLECRLALVRMPIAKGEIQGMNISEHKKNPPELVTLDDDTPRAYVDGHYMAPSGCCAETGAVLWCPVDLSNGRSVAICRRDLSDEMLALFD